MGCARAVTQVWMELRGDREGGRGTDESSRPRESAVSQNSNMQERRAGLASFTVEG